MCNLFFYFECGINFIQLGVTRALLKIAEFVEADLNDGLTGRTTKVIKNHFYIF